MTHPNPTPKLLKAVIVPFPGPGAPPEPLPNLIDPAHDDLVSLRSQTLRDPLANMLGFAELIATGDLSDDERQLYTGTLLREGRRLTSLIDNALTMRHLETGHRDLDLAPVDVRSLIQRAVAAAGEDIKRPIAMRVPESLPLVSADAEAILAVLANFLSNARVFSPSGGVINIEAHSSGDMVQVSIRDHGVGLAADELPRLFHKFYRADGGAHRRSPGAGLGLAINHRIVEAHGGQITATSKGAGKGACFQFTLPIARQATDSGHILIVEDDAVFASLIKAELVALGLTTVRAADAETAERMLVGSTPRAVILDLILPGLQGEDLLASLKGAFGARVPVVVVTGKSLTPEEIFALESAGAVAVLPKEAGAPQAAAALIAEARSLDGVRL